MGQRSKKFDYTSNQGGKEESEGKEEWREGGGGRGGKEGGRREERGGLHIIYSLWLACYTDGVGTQCGYYSPGA